MAALSAALAPQAPLLILGTVRSEELNDDHPLHALTCELRASAQLTTIELPCSAPPKPTIWRLKSTATPG
ncbi:MAG: hypothetical protein R2911_19005 [Caldilineaceae bacterium]